MIVVATAANVVGSGIAYAVGRYGGRALFLKYGRYVGCAHHLDKAERWFERRGELTVFFTRMMPGVRTFISLPAGIAKMPVGKFFFYSLLGSMPWNAALAYLGYAAGKAAGARIPGASCRSSSAATTTSSTSCWASRGGSPRRLGGVALAASAASGPPRRTPRAPC